MNPRCVQEMTALQIKIELQKTKLTICHFCELSIFKSFFATGRSSDGNLLLDECLKL